MIMRQNYSATITFIVRNVINPKIIVTNRKPLFNGCLHSKIIHFHYIGYAKGNAVN